MADSGVYAFYVEDEPNDVALLELACKKAKLCFPLRTVRDGEQAISYLSDLKGDQVPGVVLLDLKLPGLNGFDVLRWIRTQSQFKYLPVLVFTSSTREEDIQLAYSSGATAYLVKPAGFEQLTQLTRLIDSFWLHWNQRPEMRETTARSAEGCT